ncbi:MAG: PDZ domain-containing protein, partial [Planctomycetes bacterium]|nr:PDZ domain-containing protein [Planctomycetota bacterium]
IDGEAIGLNTAIMSQAGGYMGIGFAIPINMARNVKDQLVEFGKVNRGFIGIEMDPQDISSDLAKLFGLKKNKGVIVTRVFEGSPAEKGGIEKDDVIIKLNGKEVDNFLKFRNSIAMFSPGTKIKMVVWRDGKEVELKIEVGSQDESRAFGSVSSDVGRQFGLEVKDIDKELAEKYGLDVEEGVVVSKVVKGSSAEQKGLREGMVILSVERMRVSSVVEFNAIFDELADDKTRVAFFVRYGGISYYVVLVRTQIYTVP